MSRVTVIGEPGCTAEGDFETMLRLLAVAKAADCNVFKPQFCSNASRMCERRHIGPDHPKRAYYERAYGWLNWSDLALDAFAAECHAQGMDFALTVFIPEDVPTAAKYADIIKIASFENDDVQLLKAAGKTERRVIVSTGMVEDTDDPAFPMLEQAEYLQCTTAYPAPIDSMGLRLLRRGPLVGLSDHSRDLDMGAFAVCAGAYIIETHFRLYDCDPENPDYPVAFDPGELAEYVMKIRKAERAMGSGIKQIQDSEKQMLPYKVSA